MNLNRKIVDSFEDIKEKVFFDVSIKQQILLLWPTLQVYGLLFLIAYLSKGYPAMFQDYGTILKYFALIYFSIPLFFHVPYLFKNWNAILTIDTENKLFSYSSKGKQIEFAAGDIVELVYVSANGHFTKKYGKFEIYPWDPYRFYKIVLKNGERIFITCVLVNKIELVLEPLIGVQATLRKFRPFPFLH